MSVGRPTLLTPEIQAKIVAYIRAGAYHWVAARACGIPPQTFFEWVARGTGRDPVRPKTAWYAEFADQVQRACAEARIVREVKVADDDPAFWLRCGPGKERPGEPGWTESGQEGARDAVTIVIMQNGVTSMEPSPVSKPTQVIDIPALPSPKVKPKPEKPRARRHLDQRPAR